jgi:type VI secretion system protein ImpF
VTRDSSIQASILDRLIDTQPDVLNESVQHRTLDFEQGKRAVIRDLGNLLNTKCYAEEIPAAYEELARSLFVYGLKDFTSSNPKNRKMRQQLLQDLEGAVSRFEPRLRGIAIRMEQPGEASRSLKFRISGTLVLDPLSQPIMFDTYFDVNRNQYVIAE